MRSKYRRGKSESRTPALTLDMNDTTFPKEHKIPCDTAEDNDEQVEYTVHPQTRLEWQCKYNHQNKTQILYKAQPSESGQKQASSSSARSHAPKDGAPARRSPGPDLASVDLACIEALVGCEGKRLESLSCARAEAVRSKISRREAAAAARSRSHHLSSFFVRDNKNRLSISSIHLLQRLPPPNQINPPLPHPHLQQKMANRGGEDYLDKALDQAEKFAGKKVRYTHTLRHV